MYQCIQDFSKRNLRAHKEVIVGNSPDARTSDYLRRAKIRHNWPSQWKTRYPGGYIRLEIVKPGQDSFADGKIFDLARKEIDGKAAYIFSLSDEIILLHQRHELSSEVMALSERLTTPDLLAVADLVVEIRYARPGGRLSPLFPCMDDTWLRNLAKKAIVVGLGTLSVVQLTDLKDLLALPGAAVQEMVANARDVYPRRTSLGQPPDLLLHTTGSTSLPAV